jgi:diaminohydroxyphosphoribosylaminopyrimidine deaminase/5-amino-6-(5-phosphoribosylamino)uracil reductase
MSWTEALQLAVEEAEFHRGATSPNPPVGAAALDSEGQILAVAAHHRAGELHAERELLAELSRRGLSDRLHTMVVTLEPCSHHGRTPPCTDAIFASGAQRVVFAVRDPNPKAAGGEAVLREAGLEVICLSDFAATPQLDIVQRQLGPFVKVQQTGMPWITVKRAIDEQGSMIPPVGSKTFTSANSLKLAHLLRRRSDAILTGSGTILADRPELTVRHVLDHENKTRFLVIADRSGRVERDAPEYLALARSRGFEVIVTKDWHSELRGLVARGVLEVLVEAGPLLSDEVLATEWDEHWVMQKTASGEDLVVQKFREFNGL